MNSTDITYTVIRRPVKRARLEYTRVGLKVIVPHNREVDVPKFIDNFRNWIYSKQQWYEHMAHQSSMLAVVQHNHSSLLKLVQEFLAEAEALLRVKAVEVRFRAMKRQWGNCTNRGRLTFNKRLSRLPEELIRYIVFHEVCHLRSMKHGKLFHKLMKTYFPDIKDKEATLSVYGYKFGIEE